MEIDDVLRIVKSHGGEIEPREAVNESNYDIAIYAYELLKAFQQVEAEALEKAAKACDEKELLFGKDCNYNAYWQGQANGCVQCAQAIRALSPPAGRQGGQS